MSDDLPVAINPAGASLFAVESNHQGAGVVDVGLIGVDDLQPTAGETGSAEFSLPHDTQWWAVTIAIKPASSSSRTDPDKSTVKSSPGSVLANGTDTSTITVTLLDADSEPVSGHTVTLDQGGGSSVISPISSESDLDGVFTFTVTNATVETVTYRATDTTDTVTITETADVTFTPIDDPEQTQINPQSNLPRVQCWPMVRTLQPSR